MLIPAPGRRFGHERIYSCSLALEDFFALEVTAIGPRCRRAPKCAFPCPRFEAIIQYWSLTGPWASQRHLAAALKCDAVITTRLGGEEETVQYLVRDGLVSPSDHLFHLSTPVARWWDNVIFACSTFQPFRSERDVDIWCARHDLPRGAVMEIPQLAAFAADWYGDYVALPWRKRSAAEVRAVFGRHKLAGSFWNLE